MFLGPLTDHRARWEPASTRIGADPQVVREVLAKGHLLARHLQGSGAVRRDRHDIDEGAGHQATSLEEQHHVQVQLEVLGESLQPPRVTRAHLLEWMQALLIHRMARSRDRIAMHARCWIPEQFDEPTLHLLRDDPSPVRGFFMGAMPRQPHDLHQEPLRQTVPPDEGSSPDLTVASELDLSSLARRDQPSSREALHRFGDGGRGHPQPLGEPGLLRGDAFLGHLVQRLQVLGVGDRSARGHAESLQSAWMPATPKRIFLLDGHSLSYRAFFALPPTLATTTGQVTNAVYGFTSMLIKLLAEEHPDYLLVAFDKGKPTARLEMYADYKAGRAETPDEFRQQLPLILEVLETLRVPIVSIDETEADDVIATLATQAVESGLEAVVVTADRDFFQLVRPGIRVMFNRKGISDIVDYDEAAVTERFGLPPEKYLDYVALKGDPSDNLPGVPGVGEKTASRLVQEHGSVEEVLAAADSLSPKLAKGITEAGEQLVVNKELARLETDLPLDVDPDECVLGDRDDDAVRRLFNSLEFRTLLERLEEAGVTPPGGEPAELELSRTSTDRAARLLEGTEPVAVALETRGTEPVGLSLSGGGGQGVY